MKHGSAEELLEKSADSGFPADYLLCRLKGRRVRLVPDWDALVSSLSPLEQLPEGHFQRTLGDRAPDSIWQGLLFEYRWVYHQMNRGLRKTFAPFFLYAELRTMIICLRYLRELKADRVRQMLMASILSAEIREMLIRGNDAFTAAQEIEKIFLCLSEDFAGTAEVKHAEGLKGFEQRLVERYLSFVARAAADPVLRTFFRRLIDARNMLALAKLLRLGMTESHRFISGGLLSTERLDGILTGRNMQKADRLFLEATGERISSPDLRALESSLYRGIGRWLKKERRTAEGTGPVLDYLWRCSIDALNLGVLTYGQNLTRDAVSAELVR